MAPPVPIPNTAVKRLSADDTGGATLCGKYAIARRLFLYSKEAVKPLLLFKELFPAGARVLCPFLFLGGYRLARKIIKISPITTTTTIAIIDPTNTPFIANSALTFAGASRVTDA